MRHFRLSSTGALAAPRLPAGSGGAAYGIPAHDACAPDRTARHDFAQATGRTTTTAGTANHVVAVPAVVVRRLLRQSQLTVLVGFLNPVTGVLLDPAGTDP